MPTNSTTKGNGQKPTPTTGEGFDNYSSPPITATQPAQFQLHADITVGQLLNANDDEYAAFVTQVRNRRSIQIQKRSREIADLLNPQRQVEDIMTQAQQIVELESAGAPVLGQSIPKLRGLAGG